jgi:hypothetical protein
MQNTQFIPLPRVAPESPGEERLWLRAGPIVNAVRSEEDLLAAERAASACTGVCFVSCVWDLDECQDEPSHLELLRWDIVKGDVWLIYRRVPDRERCTCEA